MKIEHQKEFVYGMKKDTEMEEILKIKALLKSGRVEFFIREYLKEMTKKYLSKREKKNLVKPTFLEWLYDDQ